MGLTESLTRAFADRLADQLGADLLTELRGIRRALEVQADTQRISLGLSAVFAYAEELPADAVMTPAPKEGANSGNLPVGFQVLDALYELAAEAKIPYDDHTDIVALGVGQGWLTPDGKLTVLPASLRGRELGDGILAQ